MSKINLKIIAERDFQVHASRYAIQSRLDITSSCTAKASHTNHIVFTSLSKYQIHRIFYEYDDNECEIPFQKMFIPDVDDRNHRANLLNIHLVRSFVGLRIFHTGI